MHRLTAEHIPDFRPQYDLIRSDLFPVPFTLKLILFELSVPAAFRSHSKLNISMCCKLEGALKTRANLGHCQS